MVVMKMQCQWLDIYDDDQFVFNFVVGYVKINGFIEFEV